VNKVLHASPQARWEARIRLRYASLEGRTTLVEREHRGPLYVQKPFYPEGPATCHTILVHPPGGIAGGDALTCELALGEGSHVLATTPGAAKWYRSADRPASQALRFELATGALLEWLPQETIIFNAAQAKLTTRIALAEGAAFLGWEILCLGRTASGEKFVRGRLELDTRVDIAGKPQWIERGCVEADDGSLHSPIGWSGHSVFATLFAAGRIASPETVALCREVAAGSGARSGVTAMGPVLVARYLGNSSQRAKAYCVGVWQRLRPWLAAREAVLPRIWST
jgi:urease accessory protein